MLNRTKANGNSILNKIYNSQSLYEWIDSNYLAMMSILSARPRSDNNEHHLTNSTLFLCPM